MSEELKDVWLGKGCESFLRMEYHLTTGEYYCGFEL